MKILTALLLAAIPALQSQPRTMEIMTTPYLAPQLQFVVESGKTSRGKSLNCTPKYERKDYPEHKDTFLLLECEGGVKLRLDNISFPEGNKIVLHVDEVR